MSNADETIKHDYTFTLKKNAEMNADKLSLYIEKHRVLISGRYEKLYNSYIGEYPILSYKKKDGWKPDNRIVVNYAKYIVDTMNGFFIGVPIKITSADAAIDAYVNLINKYNDQEDNDAELAKICSLYGKGAELYFVDERSQIQIVYLNPMEYFMIYDDTVTQEPLYFVHYYLDEDGITRGTLYDHTEKYEFDSNSNYVIKESTSHGFDGVPATEYVENEEKMAIFESVYSQINAYNKAISEKSNDVDYFADAYLKVLGAKLDEDSQKTIRSNRIINFEGDEASKLIVEFMDKPSSDTTQENLLNRLERQIFQNSMVANINDEQFGASSGIALKYKLLSMSNLAKTKERKFTSGMNRRYKILFSNPINKMKEDDWIKLEYKFTQNFPANTLEEAQIASQLTGIVSKEKQLEILSLVGDVQKEMDKIKKGTDPTAYDTDYPTERTPVIEKETVAAEVQGKVLSGEL